MWKIIIGLTLFSLLVIGAGVLFKRDLEPNAVLPQPTSEPEDVEKVLDPEIKISPETILQGDPALIEVRYLSPTTTLQSITLDGKALRIFDNTSALVGIDLRGKTGVYKVVATLSDGKVLKKDLTVGARTIASAPLGIPEKLGGNTKESEQALVNSLVEEGKLIASIPTSGEKLWSGTFRFPVENPFVTDVYGYSRVTGGSSISHKGTDFRAIVGTSVYAMNSGQVRYTGYLRNYGNVIVLDHGLGLQTIYMHLSEILVTSGQNVKKGDLIAKSGETGYVLGAHLHLSIKIAGISIDPLKFLDLLGE